MYFYENAQKELFFFSFQTLAISHNIQAECLISIISHIAPALPAGTLYILEYLHCMHKNYSTDYRHYPAIHKFSIYKDYGALLPQTEYVADNEITLPMYAALTDEQIEFIVRIVDRAIHD